MTKIQLNKDWKKTVLIFACDEENILIAITKSSNFTEYIVMQN